MANMPPTAPDPPGHAYRQIQRQQQACHHCGKVSYGVFPFGYFSNTNSVSTVDAIVMATISSALIPKL